MGLMAQDLGPVYWPSWNTKSGRDYDPADYEGPTNLQEVYQRQRETAKARLAAKNPPS